MVNFEVARDIDTHTHRVGRTGRAGVKGTAYTLFVTSRDPPDFAAHLVRHLELASQSVPPRLLEMANKCAWFVENRARATSGGGHSRGGIGFQPREKRDLRAGLGSAPSSEYYSSQLPSGPAGFAASSGAWPLFQSLLTVLIRRDLAHNYRHADNSRVKICGPRVVLNSPQASVTSSRRLLARSKGVRVD